MAGKIIIKNILKLVIFLAIVCGGYFGYRYYLSLAQNNTTLVDKTSTISVYVSKDVPQNLSKILNSLIEENGWEISDSNPDIRVEIESQEEEYSSVYAFFAVTKPFTRLAESDGNTFSNFSDMVDTDIFNLLDQDNFLYDSKSDSDYTFQSFSELDGTRLVVKIDNKSIFEKSWWQEKNYPLTLEIKISGKSEELLSQLSHNQEFIDAGYTTEYPSFKDFVEIVKTGTTVAGGPGWELCERVKGSLSYPINEVRQVLEDADLAIISNESSFVDGCSQAAGTTAFCGKPTYIQNLLDMGIDVVSLTGNHMNDYGRDYFSETLDTYTENKIKYFASGKNSTEAWTPLILQTDAGTIAFIGINRMGPDGVIATDGLTGTAYYDQETLIAKLDEVKDNVDIVWLDTHLWPEYGTTPTQEQITITQIAIDNGVDIVTGVSSHEPLGMTFYKKSPVFYGLGNFLFDQMWSEETRLGIVPIIHIYDGKIVGIEILPTRMYAYCQPRFLEENDKTSVLEYFVGISGF